MVQRIPGTVLTQPELFEAISRLIFVFYDFYIYSYTSFWF